MGRGSIVIRDPADRGRGRCATTRLDEVEIGANANHCECRRNIQMSPGVQSRDDIPAGGGMTSATRHHSQTPDRDCATLSVTGEAKALCWGAVRRGIAGWRLTPMAREPMATGRLPPLGGWSYHLRNHRGRSPDPSKPILARVQ